MTNFKDSLEKILEKSVKAYNLEILGHRESGQTKLIQSIIDLIDKEIIGEDEHPKPPQVPYGYIDFSPQLNKLRQTQRQKLEELFKKGE